MAVGYRSASSTGVSDNLVSSINVPVPSGAASGDVALVALEMWEIGNPTVTAPSGFTLLTTVISGSQKLKVFWKRLTGADTGNYTFSWTGSQWTIGHAALFTGVLSSGDPIGSNFNSATAASGTTIPSTSLTVAGAHGLAHFVANENSATHTPPTSFTEVGESNYLASNYRLPGASGTYTASGGTLSASTLSLALLVALEPAASGGGPVTLDGTGAAAASATGSLSAARPLTGTVSAAASVTGSLSRARPFDGSSSAAAGASGVLGAARALAGSAASASGGSGDLTVTRPLSGTAGSSSSATGTLAVDRPLAGTAAAASSATGELAVDGQVSLDGTAPAASSASGVLSTARALSGSSPAASEAAGSLTAARALTGLVGAASSASGDLSVGRALGGSASAGSGASAELSVSSIPPLTPASVRAGQYPRASWEADGVEPVWSSGLEPRAVWRCEA